jgi:hypothetical protein
VLELAYLIADAFVHVAPEPASPETRHIPEHK